ncbi:Pao retrotransposon peptidase [Ancylostoma duodenale]|uniref:Pao retrotransposon peptidase n=1 Tax=Ancylostoma duodenale TaxID=51022 RepID=A0A0C2GK43_9BILA|nr:Pao retrotransposon peptidase [Ancylostoma duodenale]
MGPQGTKKVRILMDAGSELSFIDLDLVNEMQLPIQGRTRLRIEAFGSSTARENEHRIVRVTLSNDEGETHTCEMFDNKVITSKTVTPQLTNEDWKYVTRRGIHLTPYTEIQEAPRIHVGCDHLWELVDGKKCKLPSGLHIIATKFGNMISGKKATSPDYQETQVALNQEQTDIWDRYWSIDSSGTHEYTGPEKTEKQHLDEEVMKTFKETIVRKPEGYYVRLPWKTKHETLPENKSMALARLRSLLRQHKDRLDDLKEIDRIFKEQLQQGIIELVPGNVQRSRKNKVHYLAYQVVNTPEKKTTPKRIVFDASAHPAGKPSLNDVLYQGPLILPNILGMLMRFRMGQIATIADIEKAFLQVRLHEDDRDATRFMWVRDVTCPLQEDNILTYRFTQVTFGLNASPFLLAATISFHLDTANHSPEFAAEIKNNLYVDNLLMTAETKEEPLQQYHQTKEIFDSLKMNMREFLTNDEVLMNSFRGADKSTTTVAKVLGLEWAATTDTFKIKCNIQPDEKITKRMILHANASIYDPLGWMSPLLIRNKSFFQSLWKNNYEWDDILDEDDQEQWRKLRNSTAGFTKEIPRKVAHKQEKQTLFVFSDARVLAMAACVYIKNNESQHLLVAKTKLPSIKGVHTIPKIEINALTIATRLALTTYEELKRTVEVQKTYLFSDSEIALSWLKNASETKPTGVLVTNKVNEINRIAEKLTKEEMPWSTWEKPPGRRYQNPIFIAPNTTLAVLIMKESHGALHRAVSHTMAEGGFYERLIKDVKRSLFKALGRKVVDEDSLTTVLTEVEACLNERPLTYQETELDEMTPLRPVDFLQNRLTVTYQIDPCQDDRDDPNSFPAAELAKLRTKKEAEAALKSSCIMVDKFWKTWNEAYLTSLREHHKRYIAQGRSSQVSPLPGQVVLLQDPLRPRNTWKMGRITAVETSGDGEVRQVLLRLPSGNIVKRPINVLIPLELGQTEEHPSNPPSPPPTSPSATSTEKSQVTTHTHSENARPKRSRQVNYPYDSTEYEIYTLGVEVGENKSATHNTEPQQSCSGMSAKQAAVRLLESLNEKTRTLFEEGELQRRLEVLYDEITISLKDIDVMKGRFEEIQKQLAETTQPEDNKEIYDDLAEIARDISVTRERMVANYQLGGVLWEVYDILVRSGSATMSSKKQFEAKPRRSRRDNSRVTNAAILLREINHLDEFLRILGKTKIDYFVETRKDDPIGERLSHITQLIEGLAAPGHDGVERVELKELAARTRNIEKIVCNKLVRTVDLATEETIREIATRLEEKIDKIGQSLFANWRKSRRNSKNTWNLFWKPR